MDNNITMQLCNLTVTKCANDCMLVCILLAANIILDKQSARSRINKKSADNNNVICISNPTLCTRQARFVVYNIIKVKERRRSLSHVALPDSPFTPAVSSY